MRKVIFAFILSVASFGANAQTTVPHTFAAGTAAKASEVNNNFATLAAAINNLASRVSILEGGDAAFTVPNMAGTFKLLNIYSGGPGGSSSNVAIFSSTQSGKLTLKPDLTFQFVTSETNSRTTVSSGVNQITTSNDSIDGTWSISGKTITLTAGSASLGPYEIGAGNGILIGPVRSDSSPALLGIDIFVRQ